ncbi:MAG TPA: hypothetical protein VFG19_02620 [Geobacteraceae bacterium]|nr:hypothetical protein [Geobacteraceae bacterium]
MLKQLFAAIALICAAPLLLGKVPTASAGYMGIGEPPPGQQLPLPQLPPVQGDLRIKSPLGDIHSAPTVQERTDPGPASAAGMEKESPRTSQPPAGEVHSTPAQVKEEVQSPAPVEKPAPTQEADSSTTKMPWVLVAGGVVAAFFVGRRTRRK